MRKILLADDSLTIQKVVELTFMDEDFEVQSVRSGEDAKARLEAGRPAILIADIHVPGISGYELCREAKQRYGELPVLLLVGTFETVDEQELADSGADAHLKKPFDSQELLETVERLVAAGGGEEAEEMARPAGFEGTAHVEDEGDAGEDDGSEELARPAGFQQTAYATVEPSPATPSLAPTPARPDAPAAVAGNGASPLSDEDVDRIARRLVDLLGAGVLREVAWDVVPDLAEVVVRERLRELEAQAE
ncbi:MAG: response regulator [Thermoanaerobaculia bacterium]